MVGETTLEQRVENMLASGKLTAAEAQRLRASLNNQAQRNASQRVLQKSRRWVGPLWPLLALLVLAFTLGATSHWLMSAWPDQSAVSVTSPNQNTLSRERPIELSQLDAERSSTMNRATPILFGVIPIGILAVIGLALVLLYNSLVSSREQVNAGWAQVENVYQRRLDLVPLLVDTVQTYTDHERETLTELTEARSNALRLAGTLGGDAPQSVEQLKAIEASQAKVGTSLARLLAVVEGYPDLKASRNFLTLQDQLEGTENRVAMERRNYNEFSRRYNTRLQTFPANMVAQMMGFISKPYFQAEESALTAPEDPFSRRDG